MSEPKLHNVLAEAFSTQEAILLLLEQAEIPTVQLPLAGTPNPLAYWRAVLRELRQGLVPDGLRKLLDAALELKPGNAKLVGLAGAVLIWRQHVEQANANLTAAFNRPGVPQLLDHVYVELRMRDRHLSHSSALGRRLRLEEVLKLEPATFEKGAITGRWLLYGDPGSGKTTLLRHLAWTLARDEEAAWVPVFVSLPRAVRSIGWLAELCDDLGPVGRIHPRALCGVLEQLGRDGRLLILFDGLDEVTTEKRAVVDALLDQASTDYSDSPIVVTSRPIGGHSPGPAFRELELLPFEDDDRRRFLERWLGDAQRADELFNRLRREMSVWELASNPLYLTLLAMLFERKVDIPERRSALYDQIFQHLLEGRHRPGNEPIVRQAVARSTLCYLAAAMTEEDRGTESAGRLEDRLWDADALKAKLDKVARWKDKPRIFLNDVAQKTSILGPHDGSNADWRYWHRTFREALAAEALHGQIQREGEAAVLERARKIEGDLGRWAEPYALLVGQVDVPDALVKTLMEVNRPLGLRALATAQGLAEETIDELLGLTPDFAERREVFQGILRLLDDADAALRLIDRLRKRTSEGNDLFFLDAAAADVGKRWTDAAPRASALRMRLFDHLLDPPKDLFRWVETPQAGRIALWREIPAGTYRVGYSANQNVTLPVGLQMSTVPVTNRQYQAFDPSFKPYTWGGVDAAELPNQPAVNVTWYAAMSFCRWLAQGQEWRGTRLPTEVEWEIACRAGTTTRYWSGNSDKDLNRVGWYDKNSGGRTHRVGEKLANPWGLYDVHGNVWEWTLTEWNDSLNMEVHDPESPADLAAVASAAPGARRVSRGGSYGVTAGRARSAGRNWLHPEYRWQSQGFRVVLVGAVSPSDP